MTPVSFTTIQLFSTAFSSNQSDVFESVFENRSLDILFRIRSLHAFSCPPLSSISNPHFPESQLGGPGGGSRSGSSNYGDSG